MTESQPARATPKYRLRTFGIPALIGPEGETLIGERGQQRRRLALLAVLAAAGAPGRSRDHLLLLFWPDATQSRARHSLEQLVYAIRTSIDEDMFAGANPIRLNDAVIGSDLSAFNAAVDMGDHDKAVSLYTGAFLDGFYLDNSPEFEQWVTSTRDKLERAYAGALEQLARNAEAAGNYTDAVEKWRKLCDLDPLSSTYALGLMNAMANTGDHSASLSYAERFQLTLLQQLGTKPGPAVQEFIQKLRSGEAGKAGPLESPVAIDSSGTRPLIPGSAVTEQSEKVSRESRPRSLLFPGALVAALILAAAISWRVLRSSVDQPKAGSDTSIAVMPFVSVGGNSSDAAFVDGLSDELIAVIARIPQLRVIARTSAFALRNAHLDARAIGDSLRVANLLEGAVQRSGDKLRIQVRLVDAHDGSSRWSETYDRNLKDLFAVQSEIAAAVARELDLRLRGSPVRGTRKSPTQSIAAYELYLRGRDPIHFRSDSGPATGLHFLKAATALDSNFAAAYANMPYMYFRLAVANPDSAHAYRALARKAAERAMAIDSLLPESHTAMGIVELMTGTNPVEAERQFSRAIQLGSPRAREHLARLLLARGRPDEALTQNLKAATEDPLSSAATADVGRSMCLNGKITEGRHWLAKVEKVQPPLLRVAFYLAVCDALEGRWPSAEERLKRRTGSGAIALRAYALARGGSIAEARKIQSELLDLHAKKKSGTLELALVARGLGNIDDTFRWLRQGKNLESTNTDIDLGYVLLEALKSDPRAEEAKALIFDQNR